MIQFNTHELKARLSNYLAAALRGERVVIARRNMPVAELKPIAASRSAPWPLGQRPREDGYELPEPLTGRAAPPCDQSATAEGQGRRLRSAPKSGPELLDCEIAETSRLRSSGYLWPAAEAIVRLNPTTKIQLRGDHHDERRTL
jgi:prevent-host-death family protein